MTAIINGLTMYVKHIDTSFALLVDDNDKEYKVMLRDLKNVLQFRRVKNRLKK